DAPADRGDDALDDPHDVLVALEGHVGELELALSLDVAAERTVDHDFGDRVVLQQGLDRTESEDLVEDRLEHLLALDARDDYAFLVDELVEHVLDARADRLGVREIEARIEVVDDPRLEPDTDVAVGVTRRGRALGEGSFGRGLGRTAARWRWCARSLRRGGLLPSGTLTFD